MEIGDKVRYLGSHGGGERDPDPPQGPLGPREGRSPRSGAIRGLRERSRRKAKGSTR